MSYYGAGDYYGAGGFGGFLKGVARGAVGFATGGPVGAISALVGSRTRSPQVRVPTIMPVPGIRGAAQRMIPGGATGFEIVKPRRRRMNYANSKALTRANRRVDGFVKLAKKSLKHTQYTIVTKSSRRSKPRVTVRESGPGSVRVG